MYTVYSVYLKCKTSQDSEK